MYRKNTECRMCGGMRLVKFLDLGEQPFANSFLAEKDLGNEEPTAPLEVYWCRDCSLAQLLHVVDPEVLFRDYVYFSSGMPKISDHWNQYAAHVMVNFLRDPKELVVEIGSNDGILLMPFRDKGFRILGIDPAENIADIANGRGILTIPKFFSSELARMVVRDKGRASAILANNVFAHIDDHRDFMRGIDVLLSENGVLVIEAPYLLDMFKNLAYDTIYHEHLSFLAVRPLIVFFAKFGFEIFDVQLVKAQGTSLRLFVGRRGKHEVKPSVFGRVSEELALHLDQESAYRQLAARVEKSKMALRETLILLKSQGKRIAAYGAPAKGNTLLNYCDIGSDVIDYALENLPSKQGLYTPGMYIPVMSPVQVATKVEPKNPVDYYLLLAWNYREAILETEKAFIARGGKFIVPIGDDIAII